MWIIVLFFALAFVLLFPRIDHTVLAAGDRVYVVNRLTGSVVVCHPAPSKPAEGSESVLESRCWRVRSFW
jgi:hypothetical protein